MPTSISRILRIANVPVDLRRHPHGWHTCSARDCIQQPNMLILQWRERAGRPYLARLHFCETHADRWCTRHGITLHDVPTIDFWDERRPDEPTPYWPAEWLPVMLVEPHPPTTSL
jgi:hypothetical protein